MFPTWQQQQSNQIWLYFRQHSSVPVVAAVVSWAGTSWCLYKQKHNYSLENTAKSMCITNTTEKVCKAGHNNLRLQKISQCFPNKTACCIYCSSRRNKLWLGGKIIKTLELNYFLYFTTPTTMTLEADISSDLLSARSREEEQFEIMLFCVNNFMRNYTLLCGQQLKDRHEWMETHQHR